MAKFDSFLMATPPESMWILSCEHTSRTADSATQGGPPTHSAEVPWIRRRHLRLLHIWPWACASPLCVALGLCLPFASCLWISPKVFVAEKPLDSELSFFFFNFNISFGWESIECQDARHIQFNRRCVSAGRCDCFPDNSKFGPELMI